MWRHFGCDVSCSDDESESAGADFDLLQSGLSAAGSAQRAPARAPAGEQQQRYVGHNPFLEVRTRNLCVFCLLVY